MAMNVGGGKRVQANINVTPLIDVLAGAADHLHGDHAPDAVRAGGHRAATAQERSAQKQDERTVVIQIAKDRSMKINEEPTDFDKLGPRLEQVFKTRAERVVFVKGDPDLDYQTVARAIDIARAPASTRSA